MPTTATVTLEPNPTTGSEIIAALRDYAENVLRPQALRVDIEGMAAETLRELDSLGALNHMAPPRFGGAGLGAVAEREIQEILAGACLNTWLIWVQHAGVVLRFTEQLAAGTITADVAAPVLRGQVLTGAALSDVRHYPNRYVAAKRVDGGWLLNGTVSWFTGWGVFETVLIAAVCPDTEQVITSLVPLGNGFTAEPMPLASMGGSRTAKLRLSDVFVPDRMVTETEDFSVWAERDGRVANDAKASTFGLADAVIAELRAEPTPAARQVADVWAPIMDSIRALAYEHETPRDDAEGSNERLQRRARAAAGLLNLTQALLTSRAGRGMVPTDTAMLHVRSALFLQIQGQTPQVRAAQLGSFLPS